MGRRRHYNGMERKDKELMDLINNFFLLPPLYHLVLTGDFHFILMDFNFINFIIAPRHHPIEPGEISSTLRIN